MSAVAQQFDSVEDYLDSLGPEVRSIVEQVGAAIRVALPQGEHTITYNIPTVVVEGRRVVHYAGWKKHVSLYPAPADEDLQAELAPYVAGRGTLKFPVSQPVPYDLIATVARRLSAALPGSD
ncbi:MAG: hypothetical protein JWR90_1330 [Marmoricola sp.]|nr:hypothetical protein [Marmoricola sp.]